MNYHRLYILLVFILSFSSCSLFETQIIEDRSSFIKFFPKNNADYNAINGDYLVNTNDGFLLGGSLSPQASFRLSTLIQVSHTGEVIDKKDIANSLVQYTKILPSTSEYFYFLGSFDDNSSSDIIKMSLNDAEPTKKLQFGTSVSPIDFSVLPNNNLIVITKDDTDFPSSTLELTHLDEDLNIIWEREFKFEETSFIGLSIMYEESTGHFIILGKNGLQKLFILEVNEDGNTVNLRFFEEFNFEPVSLSNGVNSLYQPVLLDMETHYLVVEGGKLYSKNDNSPYVSIYRIDKDLNNITLLETNTDFASINTIQRLNDEVVINGFLTNGTFAIKKLNSEGNLVNWSNGEEFVTFNMDLEQLGDGNIFASSPSLSDYNDFFIPGNIVQTPDEGYAMIGTFGVFNGDDFEAVMTLFKFRSDGSY